MTSHLQIFEALPRLRPETVRILPLGGLGEIGLNMLAIQAEDRLLIIDCGLMFPEAYMLGIDLVIPDISAIAGPQNFQFTNNPGRGSGSGGTCSGDSGGPAFWIQDGLETTTIIAITSSGITPQCSGNGFHFRTDTAAAQTFLATFGFGSLAP